MNNEGAYFWIGALVTSVLALFISLAVGDAVTPEQIAAAQQACLPNDGLKVLVTTDLSNHIEFVCNNGIEGDAPVTAAPTYKE